MNQEKIKELIQKLSECFAKHGRVLSRREYKRLKNRPCALNSIERYIGTPFIFSICVREPDEIQKIKNRYPDASTILIRRPGLELFDNMADQNVENFNYDFVINNDSTMEDFEKVTIDFFNSNLKEELNA